MKVAVVNLTAGGLSGGYRKYLTRLVPLLRRNPAVEAVDVFVPATAADSIRGSAVEPFTTWDAKARSWSDRVLRDLVARRRPDVVLIPTARWADFGVPTVVMVRNMEPLTAPLRGNSLSEGTRNLARRLAARQACRRADGIVAVSSYVRDFIVRQWHVTPDRIGVVHHGVDAPDGPGRPPALAGLTEPFLFTAGSIRPARGLTDVIRALATPEAGGLSLVIAGAATPGSHDHERGLRDLAASLGVAGRITWAGHLDAPAMAWCFEHCRAFVMTSRMEACPNLVLEALAHGAVSISTDAPPMPEFFGDAAWYYRGGDAASLADTLHTVLGAPAAELAARREGARERSRGFRWEDTAERTVRVLQQAVTAHQPTRRSA